MDLSIIIVNWNSETDVRRCVTSVFANTTGIKFEIIVVDGASFDGCGKMLATEFPQVKFIQSPENVGFGRANNLGVQSATGEYLLLLNPDTEVLGTAISTMLAGVRALPRAGCVGCRLLNSDRSLQTSCVQSFPTIANQILDSDFLRNRFPNARLWGVSALFKETTEPAEIEAVAGACVMIKRDVYAAVGGFSPEYFMYAEDMDLSYKTHQAGWTNYYLPNASIVHYGDGSVRKARSNFAVVMSVDSLTTYFRKHHGGVYAWTYRLLITLASVGRLALLLPSRLVRLLKGGEDVTGSWSKWKAILRWGVGLERWQLKYR